MGNNINYKQFNYYSCWGYNNNYDDNNSNINDNSSDIEYWREFDIIDSDDEIKHDTKSNCIELRNKLGNDLVNGFKNNCLDLSHK